MSMKKTMAFILTVALLLPALATASFATDSFSAPSNTTMSVDEFENRYVGNNPTEASLPAVASINEVSPPSITYSNIVYNAATREIEFDAALSVDGVVSNFSAEGTLYSSYKADLGINSIVGDLSDSSGQYEILRFEIYNDDDLSRLYAINTPATATTPTLLFYLKQGDDLYLFETAIPAPMSSISIPNTEANKTTEGRIDGFWFQDIVEPEMVATTAETGNLSRGVEDNIPITNLSATWTISGVQYRYFASVNIYYRITDVTNANYMWQVDFEITDAYCKVDGVRSELTGLRITNIDIAFATGEYTKMIKGTPNFDLHDSWFVASPDTINGLIGIAAGATYPTTAAHSLLTILGNRVLEDYTIEAGEDTMFDPSGSDASNRAFRYKVPSRYFMQHEGQFVSYNLLVTGSTYGQSGATSGYRIGRIEIEFDYYVSGGDYTNCPVEPIEGIYHCNPFP